MQAEDYDARDNYPPNYFVAWHDELQVDDLWPGQWTLRPDGRLLRRLSLTRTFETFRTVVC